MYGLKPVPFVCSEIGGIPHLKIEMWGTQICFTTNKKQILRFAQDDKLSASTDTFSTAC